MSVNYTEWSIAKLKKEIKTIEKHIKQKERAEKKVVLAKITAVARQSGFELGEVLQESHITLHATGMGSSSLTSNAADEGKASQNGHKVKAAITKKRAPAKVKYINPANKQDTWTGRGRKPLWVVAHLKNGGSLNDVAIN